MPDTFEDALPLLTGALFGLALLLFLVSFRLFRRSRTDVFWRRRRDAGQRGWQIFVAGFVLLLFSGASCGATVLTSLLIDDTAPPPAATQTPGQVAEQHTPPPPLKTNMLPPLPTLSPSPAEPASPASPSTAPPTQAPPETVAVIITTTPVHTPTETSFPTFTPVNPPLQSDITPLPNAQIVITALDDQISDALTAIHPRNIFVAGTQRIYLFVEFRGMVQGVLWKRHLYRDGELLDGNSYLWGLENEGTGYFFFGNDSGFEPGQYEIRLYIGDNPAPVNMMAFTVTAPSS